MNIEIYKRNPFKEFIKKLHSKLEDFSFALLQKLPESLVPTFLLSWAERYLDNRIAELKQDIVRSNWKALELEKAANNIQSRQQTKE